MEGDLKERRRRRRERKKEKKEEKEEIPILVSVILNMTSKRER